MLNVEMLRPLVEAAWGRDTCDPAGRDEWRPENPSWSQCGVTALVVQDLLGGDLIHGEVHMNGAKAWNHYWNRLSDGTEVDLTADQFRVLNGASVVNGQVVHRPPEGPRRCREEYELLRERVLVALSAERAE
ncbi:MULTISPECIES: YunG family protein [Streptomyces]|uniref:Uncharacterized protein n=1 Tax=Streptomyces eurythermus TaxID=42237 RepID=A0ABW6Z3Q2_9ACTN|nr:MULTISPECIES: hypothetical protein [Streptomyces]QIS75182.1 hypothetical protein HB370_38855 [Streptomyces sp. DSM 40868]